MRVHVEAYFALTEIFATHLVLSENLNFDEAEIRYRYQRAVERFRKRWPGIEVGEDGS